MPNDSFAQLIPEARAFLRDLAAHNNRDWFLEHKARYDSTLKVPATLLMDQIAYDLGRETGQTLTPKLFRPHRDMRFSKDKTPYHTHLHMMWAIGGPGLSSPSLFFGISADSVRVGGGQMQFDKAALPDWRTAIDGPFGDKVQALLDDLASHGLTRNAPSLKRVPSGFSKDHPREELLRRKGLAVWGDLAMADWGRPVASLGQIYGRIFPLIDLLARGF